MVNPYYAADGVTLYLDEDAGCLAILPTLPDASVDAIVCDPPYELGIMGKAWDASGIAYNTEVWRQCWRVLKPGGHLLAFGGTRTYHRMTVAIEDAGFEIRDSLHWIYGSGFPKGQDVAKSIDRRRDDGAQVRQVTAWLATARDAAGWTNKQIEALFGFNGNVGNLWTTQGKAAMVPTLEQWDRLREAVGFDDSAIRPLVVELNTRKGSLGEAWSQREVIGSRSAGLHQGSGETVMLAGAGTALNPDGSIPVTAPASDAARRWQGWNTALKPAHEPIVMARKSTGYNTTVANVLEHGTGALNIDACRTAAGRWPTNLLLGHGPQCVDGGDCQPGCPATELGAEARFFPVFRYEAKAPASERPRLDDGTAHTTVKPLALIRWLVRLVTPPGGTVLDWCAGSGTTLEACVIEGFPVIGIELERPHAELCRIRLSKPIATALFGDFDPAA
jgi:DNA modification methylase